MRVDIVAIIETIDINRGASLEYLSELRSEMMLVAGSVRVVEKPGTSGVGVE